MRRKTSLWSLRSTATDLPVLINCPICLIIALNSWPAKLASSYTISATLLTVRSFLKTFLPLRSKPIFPYIPVSCWSCWLGTNANYGILWLSSTIINYPSAGTLQQTASLSEICLKEWFTYLVRTLIKVSKVGWICISSAFGIAICLATILASSKGETKMFDICYK